MSRTVLTCPGCGTQVERPFYEVNNVPVHQVRLVPTREAALACDKDDVALAFCPSCGFVWNSAFDPELMRYAEDYESTQAVSPTFNAFHARLAHDLVERFDLRGKQIIEIGCGQGEFITMLAELGGNRGIGFDRVNRGASTHPKVAFVKDFYAEPYRHLRPDFVCCKMTLEHVHDTGAMLSSIRRTLGDRPEVVVFFMIPEVTRILDLRAFWDIYYEHCSYFSPGSLARTFRHAGFDPIDVWCDYDDQYVLIAARPGAGAGPILEREDTPEELAPKVQRFAASVARDQARWRDWLGRLTGIGKKTVLWGGGSKAVAFLATLRISSGIDYAVDINPRRNGTYVAGTGQKIVMPGFLTAYQPDVIIVMSPIYLSEIQAMLGELGVRPSQLITVEEPERLAAA